MANIKSRLITENSQSKVIFFSPNISASHCQLNARLSRQTVNEHRRAMYTDKIMSISGDYMQWLPGCYIEIISHKHPKLRLCAHPLFRHGAHAHKCILSTDPWLSHPSRLFSTTYGKHTHISRCGHSCQYDPSVKNSCCCRVCLCVFLFFLASLNS